MSDRDRNTEHNPLPEALEQLESKLRLTQLPEVGLDRDAMMYRVGYAAAERDLGRPRLVAWAWPIASALAACLATVLVMRPATPVGPAEQLVAESAAPDSESPAVDLASDAAGDEDYRVWPRRRFWPASAPLLTMRDRALRAEWYDVPTSGLAGGSTAAPATSRELLHELLPDEAETLEELPGLWKLRRFEQEPNGMEGTS